MHNPTVLQTTPPSVESGWLKNALEGIEKRGFSVVNGVLSHDFIEKSKVAMRSSQQSVLLEVGRERIERAGELGVLRLMLKTEPHFYQYLEIPELLAVIDHTVGNTAIMHLQNGFILPSFAPNKVPEVFQNSFHMDFPRYMNGYLASINVFFALDDFTEENGTTRVIPGSHQKPERPDSAFIREAAIPLVCPAGSMIVFDSTLWHAAGHNVSGKERYAINHQFTKSFFKQQIDYVRALGEDAIVGLPPRTQQLLGYYTRVVTSLDEYYRPEEERLYRKGQG